MLAFSLKQSDDAETHEPIDEIADFLQGFTSGNPVGVFKEQHGVVCDLCRGGGCGVKSVADSQSGLREAQPAVGGQFVHGV